MTDWRYLASRDGATFDAGETGAGDRGGDQAGSARLVEKAVHARATGIALGDYDRLLDAVEIVRQEPQAADAADRLGQALPVGRIASLHDPANQPQQGNFASPG
jgi:hypothetical protein